MTSEQVQALIRNVLLTALGALGSLLVSKGILTTDQASTLVPEVGTGLVGVAAVAVAYWSHKSQSPAALVAAVNSSSVPGVKVVAASSTSQQVTVSSTGAVKPDYTATVASS